MQRTQHWVILFVMAALLLPFGTSAAAAQERGAKRIEVDLARQLVYAYEGDHLVYTMPTSTGKDGFETPRGRFTIYSKVLEQDMRGQVGSESWDIPNVTHAMYFLQGGFAFHGVYWHYDFGTGRRRSHGCVGLGLNHAAQLYEWAPLGTPVVIY
jgi:lipoprotein-anchoring transpeptidase ErfK/SrfK